jgi:hypothetical protein
MKDAATQSQAASAYLTRLLTIDEARAAQWAQNAPPPVREPTLLRLVFDWYHTDSKAASDWVNALPEGGNRDIALAALSRRLRIDNRAAAEEVAAKISDPRRRSGAQQSLMY